MIGIADSDVAKKKIPFKTRKKHILEKGYVTYLALLCMKQEDIAKIMGINYHTLNSMMKRKHGVTKKNMDKIKKFHDRYSAQLDRQMLIMLQENKK